MITIYRLLFPKHNNNNLHPIPMVNEIEKDLQYWDYLISKYHKQIRLLISTDGIPYKLRNPIWMYLSGGRHLQLRGDKIYNNYYNKLISISNNKMKYRDAILKDLRRNGIKNRMRKKILSLTVLESRF